MKALMALALALCCHAAPKAAVPLVYTAVSSPVGLPSVFNTFMPLVQGANPLVTSSTSEAFPQPPSLLRYASLHYPALPLGLPSMQYLVLNKDGKMVLSDVRGSLFNFRTPFGVPMGSSAYFDRASAAPIMTPDLKMVGTLSPKSTKERTSSEMGVSFSNPAFKPIDTLTPKSAQRISPSQSKAEDTDTRANPTTGAVFKTAGSPTTVKAVHVEDHPAHPTVLFNAADNEAVAGVSVSPLAVPTAAIPSPLEAPNPPAPSHDVPFRGGRFHTQDELGQYSFGHFGGSHTRLENKDFLGHTRGSFAYVDLEGDVHVRKYAAAPGLGFTVAGSDIPVAPVGVSKVRSSNQDPMQKKVKTETGNKSAGPAVTTA